MGKPKRKTKFFQDDLLPDEEVLWIGQPSTGPVYLFSAYDLFLVPFSFVWASMACPVSFGFVAGPSAIGFSPISLLFGAVGLYITVGRFIQKAWIRSRTHYAVTNRRILIVKHLWSRQIQSLYINAIPSMELSSRGETGTIRFGPPTNFWRSANWGGDDYSAPTFYSIPKVREVYSLVTDLRENLTSDFAAETYPPTLPR